MYIGAIWILFAFFICNAMKKIYNKIEKSFDKYVINQVNIKFPHYREHKYSDQYCLSMFKEMLNDVVITGHIKNRTVVYMYSFFNMYINSICIYVKYILF